MVQSETLPRMTLDGRIGALTMLGNRLVYPVPGNNKTTLPRFFYIHTRLSLLRWFHQRARAQVQYHLTLPRQFLMTMVSPNTDLLTRPKQKNTRTTLEKYGEALFSDFCFAAESLTLDISDYVSKINTRYLFYAPTAALSGARKIYTE